jgi:hypothetical protein
MTPQEAIEKVKKEFKLNCGVFVIINKRFGMYEKS